MAFEYQGFATLGVNLNRQKYGPLDISNVFTSENDLKYYLTKGAHTAGVSKYWYESADKKVVPYPYEGQVLATVIDGVVNVYALALDAEGKFTTQEIAGKIEVDDKTIKLNADGKLELVGLPTDIANKTFVPSLVNGVLTWAEPDTSTAEGQAQEIEGLKTRATALEETVNGKPAKGEEGSEGYVAPVTGLVDKVAANTQAIADEASARASAIEHITNAETGVIAVAIAGEVEARNDAIKVVADKIGTVAEGSTLVDMISEVENKIPTVPTNVSEFTNDAGYLTAHQDISGKADKADTYTKTEVDTAINDAKKSILGEDVAEAYDTLKEIQNILEGTDGEAIDGLVETVDANKQAIATLTGDATTEGSVDKKIADAVAHKANTADVVAIGDFNKFKTENSQAIATAKQEAINDAKAAEEAKGYAVATEVAATYATKAALAEVDGVAKAAATQTFVEAELAKKINSDLVYTKGEIDLKIGTPGAPEIPAQGVEGEEGYVPKVDAVAGTGIFASTYSRAEVDALLDVVSGGSSETAASVKRQLDTYKSENDNRVALIEQKNTTQDTNIQTNANAIAAIVAADTGILAQANSYTDSQIAILDSAYKAADTALGGRIDNINALIAGDNGINAKITALQNKDVEIEAEISSINTTIDGHIATLAEHTTAIANLEKKDTELAALIKANTDSFANYTTTELMNKAIDDKIAAIDSSALQAAIAQNASDIAAEVTRAKAAESANATAIAALVGTVEGDNAKSVRTIAAEEVAKVVDSAPEAFDTLKEIADWIGEDTTGAAAMSAAIATNTADIATNAAAIAVLNGDGDGSVVKQITTAINAIPTATAEVAGLVKASETISVTADGTMNVAKVSTDLLVQGANELILMGGNANASVNTEA